MANLKWRTMASVAVVVPILALAGCGSKSSPTSTATFATPPAGPSGVPSALGTPADASKATRTVVVHAGDDLKYQPASISVKVGETITFQVVNDGKAQHDFVLGDAKTQDDHQASMAGMQAGSQMLMPDASNAVHIPPAQTKSITWTFTTAGSTLYGSHEPGDYAGGMKGTITVS